MAKKVQPDDIQKMLELYQSLGTYAAVAREVGFSVSTVRKYILENQTVEPVAAVKTFDSSKLDGSFDRALHFMTTGGDLCVLTDDEKKEVEALWEELSK